MGSWSGSTKSAGPYEITYIIRGELLITYLRDNLDAGTLRRWIMEKYLPKSTVGVKEKLCVFIQGFVRAECILL